MIEIFYPLIIIILLLIVLKIVEKLLSCFPILNLIIIITAIVAVLYTASLTIVENGTSFPIFWTIIYFLPFCYPIFFIFLNYFVKYIAQFSSINSIKDPIDFSKEKDYYRDLLNECTIAEISYLDDMRCNLKKDSIATLLQLEKKGFIRITNLYIEVDQEMILKKDQLSKLEQYVLNNIKGGILKLNSKKNFRNIIEAELVQKGLIKGNYKTLKNILVTELIAFLMILIVSALFDIFIPILPDINLPLTITFSLKSIVGIIESLTILLIISFMIMYPKAINDTYIRTDKGLEICRKIKQLKNYIRDFSKLDSRSKEELTTWGDYLVYSVGFGINKKILKKIKQFTSFISSKTEITIKYDI